MCMCDEANNYLCLDCEGFYKDAVRELIHEHRDEILETGDWWWTVNNYDINVHCPDDPEDPEAVFEINLYRLDREETSSYDSSVQWDLPSLTRKQIELGEMRNEQIS